MTRSEYESLKAEPETYKKICNGLGPNEYRKLIQFVLGKGFLKMPADIHDVDYLCGNMTQKLVDRKFHQNCKDWLRAAGAFDNVKLRWLIFLCWIALKKKGHEHYNKRKTPIPFITLLLIARESENENEVLERCRSYPDS